LTPYLIEPLSYIGNTEVDWIGIFAPTQSGKSVFLQCAVADAIDQDPGPLLYLLPDEVSGKKQIREKVIQMIDKSPFLSAHLTGRKFDVNLREVSLDNMTITTGWAGSLSRMSSTPYKRVVLDEVRLMKLAVGEESNAIKFAGDRLTTYLDMGIGQGYMVSSPSVEGDLLHQQLSVPNTLVLVYHVPCLKCGEYQQLDFFTHLKFDKDLGKAKCLCIHCGAEFPDEDKKRSWNKNGVYAPKGAIIYPDGSLKEPYEPRERMFFHWSSMESPFRSFHRIWNEYVQTKDKLQDYRNFWQCWLARFWINDISKTSVLQLKDKRGQYSKQDVPDGTKVLLAGIDTQDDGFYICVRAFGEQRRTWLVDEYFIPCKMELMQTDEITTYFQRDLFDRIYLGFDNKPWKVALVAIDTGGHRTQAIYQAAKNFPKLVLVKGKDAQNTTFMYNKDINLYLVRTCEYLDETEERCQTATWNLPENVSQDYLNQFCNIRKKQEQNKRTGEKTIVWKKIGRCDYRFADLHAFILLDLPTDRGQLRSELEKPLFYYNPMYDLANRAKAELAQAYEEPQNGYDIGDFNW